LDRPAADLQIQVRRDFADLGRFLFAASVPTSAIRPDLEGDVTNFTTLQYDSVGADDTQRVAGLRFYITQGWE